MQASDIVLWIALAALIVVCAILTLDGHYTAPGYLITLVAAAFGLAAYQWSHRHGPERLQPMSFRRAAIAYFKETGWFVVGFLLLIVIFSVFVTR